MGGWLLALLISRIEFLQVRADNWDRPPVRRWGRRFRLREHDIDRATAWFDRHGPAAVFFGHLLPVIRTFISLPAGIAGMDPVRFGIYTTIGCIPWTAALAYAGYALGANWQSIVNGFRGPTAIIAAIVAIALAIAIWRYARARRAESESPHDQRPHPARKPPGTGTPR